MFEVGFTEIILILGIGLLVLGPEKLPKVAAQIGRWAGRARAMARNLKDQLDDEVRKAEEGFTQPTPGAAPQHPAAQATGTPAPISDIAAGAAGIAAAGSAAATTAAPAAESDDFAHNDDPYLRDGDPPLPPAPAAAEVNAGAAPADAPAAEAAPTEAPSVDTTPPRP